MAKKSKKDIEKEEAAAAEAESFAEETPVPGEDKKEPSRSERIASIVGNINKKYGVNTASMGCRTSIGARISTGSVLFDRALGGGIPVGRVTQFWGAESGGKTYCAIKAGANAQKLCSKCYTELKGFNDPVTGKAIRDTCVCGAQQKLVVAFCDVEGTFDEVWAAALGLDLSPDVFVYMRPETSEEAIDSFEALMRSGDVDFAIFDSIAAAAPMTELEKSTEDAVVGKGALLMNRAWRVWNSAMTSVANRNGIAPTLITINQERFKVGVMYGDPSTRPGGNGQKFANSIEVKMKKAVLDNEDSSSKGLPLVTFAGKVTKNKTARPFLEYEFQVATEDLEWKGMFFPKGSIVEIKPLIDLATKFGLMGKDDKAKDFFYKEHRFKLKKDLFDKMIFTQEGLAALRRDVLELMQRGKIG